VLNEEALRRALGAVDADALVRWDDVTTSTNDTAMAMAADGAPAWTLVAAGHQTRGRGRRGRTWEDRPGRALLCSVVLRPALEPERLGLVSIAAGTAMAEAASAISGLDVRCTWPNDLFLGDSKVGGVLAESEVAGSLVRHVVVGVGVNIDAPDGVPGAGGIGEVDVEALLGSYLSSLDELIDAPDEEVRGRWVAVSRSLGRRVEATRVGGDAVRGVAADLDDTGALLVDTDAGRVRVAFGEVHHLGDGPD
jgi:BirA family transcriptional regulator, biotin operon repressor / biotin---[acetyl-CoA-carboxylase] ligase